MYKYVNNGGDVNIATVGLPIKKEVISQTPELIHLKLEYPNDWILEIKEYAHKVEFYSNKELEKQEDGKLHLKQ